MGFVHHTDDFVNLSHQYFLKKKIHEYAVMTFTIKKENVNGINILNKKARQKKFQIKGTQIKMWNLFLILN